MKNKKKRKNRRKEILKMTPKKKAFMALGLTYFLVSGVLIFAKPKKVGEDYIEKSNPQRFYHKEEGPDRVAILDDPYQSGQARLKIISEAEKRLDVSYFSIGKGHSPDLFFAALLEAADRGVQVNVLLDGIYHGIKGDLKPILYASILHPNMNIRFYESPNPLLPWTFNNRMHDKYILVDDKYAMIGGRNIADNYFDPPWYEEKVTLDRDALIINTSGEAGVIQEIDAYFQEIWNHKFTRKPKKQVYKIRKKRAENKYYEVRDKLDLLRLNSQDLGYQDLDLYAISHPTNKISFIHNPLQRFNKEPWLWYEISEMIKSAKDKVMVQSPYTIPTRSMMDYYKKEDMVDIEISLLTNSMASSPNFPGFGGYLNHRQELLDRGVNIYEYQSINSLHTKACVIDDELMVLGSFNVDARSTHLSTESMVVIHGQEAVAALNEGIDGFLQESLQVDPQGGYLEGPVQPLGFSKIKKALMTFLSVILKPFEFML